MYILVKDFLLRNEERKRKGNNLSNKEWIFLAHVFEQTGGTNCLSKKKKKKKSCRHSWRIIVFLFWKKLEIIWQNRATALMWWKCAFCLRQCCESTWDHCSNFGVSFAGDSVSLRSCFESIGAWATFYEDKKNHSLTRKGWAKLDLCKTQNTVSRDIKPLLRLWEKNHQTQRNFEPQFESLPFPGFFSTQNANSGITEPVMRT